MLLALAGAAAGFVAGLLGIGGGFVVVPVLLWVLPWVLPAGISIPHIAVASSLACIVITAISSTWSHHRRGSVDWRAFAFLAPGSALGAWMGAQLGSQLDGQILAFCFAAGALLTAFYLLLGKAPAHRKRIAAGWSFSLFGLLSGMASALIGIGGGSLNAPFLKAMQRPMVVAVGTAAAIGLPLSLSAAVGYLVASVKPIAYATGYVWWPAVLAIVLLSALTAPMGARLAHQLAEQQLKRAFALFLIFSALQILYSHWP